MSGPHARDRGKLATALARIRELEAERDRALVSAAPRPKPKSRSASKSDWWCSPPEIADAVWEFFGGEVDVDPCSNPLSLIKARVAYTAGGLVLPWRCRVRPRRTCYENPPYSKLVAWTDKMLHELRVGNVAEHIRLTMFAPSSAWWVSMCCMPQRNPRILATKRLSFIDPEAPDGARDTRYPCRFDPALIYVGPDPERFTRTFAHVTRWTTWGRT